MPVQEIPRSETMSVQITLTSSKPLPDISQAMLHLAPPCCRVMHWCTRPPGKRARRCWAEWEWRQRWRRCSRPTARPAPRRAPVQRAGPELAGRRSLGFHGTALRRGLSLDRVHGAPPTACLQPAPRPHCVGEMRDALGWTVRGLKLIEQLQHALMMTMRAQGHKRHSVWQTLAV